MTLTRKITQAFSIMMVGVVLEYSGFVSGAGTQSDSAILGLNIALLDGTALFLVFSFFSSFRFVLDSKNHATLIKEVERLKAGGELSHADREVKSIVESLNGWKHHQT